MSYNTEPRNSTLAEVLAMAPNARQDAIVAYFHKASAQHNALMGFTSSFDPNQQNGGVTSIFCEKTDLRAGGKSRVHFNTIGMPAGPGAVGAGQLTGNESKSAIGTYSAAVDWIRDAVSLTQDEIEMIEAGRNLKATMKQLLARKMGLTKQNHGLMRLIRSATSVNTYRVGNRASTNALTADDTLSLEVSNITRAMLNTLGATPLKKNVSKPGCPVNKFMLFATDQALLPIRNDSLFSTAKDADVRGSQNANFTGELLDWQGNSFYEFPQMDMAWDDYKGGPLLAKAKVVLANPITPASTGDGLKLTVNASNTLSRYFQFFDGHPWQFSRQESLPNFSGNEYYAWACNPDGSRVFFSYDGLNGVVGGNTLTVKKILSPQATGSADATTVGQLTTGTNALDPGATTAADEFLGGGDSNLLATGPNGTWKYSNTIDSGAVILQANSQGVVYARSFMLASMAALFAHGRVKMAEIEQNFDYDYVMGNGFQMIFGTGVVLDPLGNPNGYIMIEHALDVVGYPCPSSEA
ncbi:MAG: hypothetical protein LLG20_22630 [Acidobacteriales bacterium]|nr:hypothetical protein [Terriglobales bacterium]